MKSTQPQQVAGGTKTIGGIAANSLMRPIIIVLALLHVAIIGLIMQINATSAELSETMKTSKSKRRRLFWQAPACCRKHRPILY